MKTIHVIALAAAVLMLAACSRPATTSVSAMEPAKHIQVPVGQAETRVVPAGFDATGTFAADETSDVAPPVAGHVVATPVNEGDFVRKGQVICELDPRDAQIRLDQARAQVNEATAGLHQSQSRIGLAGGGNFEASRVPEVAAARANYESAQAMAKQAAADAQRFANLVASGDVSRSAYEKARTQQETAEAQANAARQQYEAALNGARQGWGAVETSLATVAAVEAQLAQAEKGLADTIIRAPFDGFVTARPVAAGEYVSASSKIATIVKVGTLKLQLQVPEQRAALVKLGMPVHASVAAWPGRKFTGKVTAINPSIDPNSRIFILEAQFSSPSAELRPGMFATAKVVLPGGENGVFVPRSAVIRDRTTDSYQVFTVENGTAHLKVVVPGDSDSGKMRIASGLSGNETVAAGHLDQLFDGVAVEVRNQ